MMKHASLLAIRIPEIAEGPVDAHLHHNGKTMANAGRWFFSLKTYNRKPKTRKEKAPLAGVFASGAGCVLLF
jgi:hypothetical protein